MEGNPFHFNVVFIDSLHNCNQVAWR